MKPKWIFPGQFEAVLTDRTERSFLFRRHVYRVTCGELFMLQDRDGVHWRPHVRQFDSDGASVPHPLDWLIPALDPLRYQRATMGIHDPACRFKKLEQWSRKSLQWEVVAVGRSQADDLLAQALEASGAWRLTRGAYWLGVRVGSGFKK